MAKRDVIWTRTADIQFVGVLEYWVLRNKSKRYSLKLLQLVEERVIQIAKQPLINKPTDFHGVHVASLGNYSIYYKFNNDEVYIMAFWDNRQDPKKLMNVLNKSLTKDLKL